MIYFVTNQTKLIPPESYKICSVEDSLKMLSALTVVGLDTETEGFDPYTKALLSLQLGNRDFQVVIDTSTIDVKLYKDFLESDRTFCGWNLKFDLKFLYHHGIYPKKVFDGFLAEKLLWLGYPAGMHSMSLKSAGETYLNVELDKSIRGKIHYEGLSEDVIVYGANDVKYLEDIILKQWELLKKKGLTEAIKVENKFVLALSYMEYCGIKLDVQKWKEKMNEDSKKHQHAIEELNNWVVNFYNEHNGYKNRVLFNGVFSPFPYVYQDMQGDLFEGFQSSPKCVINWDSPKQVIPLFKLLGFNLDSKNKSGELSDSIEAKVIEPQKHVSSIAPIYLEYKAYAKVVGTYGQNFLNQINPVSGRLHTSYSQLGADTTRLTSGGKDKSNNVEYINLLNIPSDEKTRACFTAEYGNKWISIDYSGQETYLMASIANDEAIIKELTEGSGDIHSLTAYMSYKEIPRDTPITEIKKKFHNLRQEAKGIEFAINYGGNADTIARNKGIPIEEANTIYNSYMSGFTGLKKYQDFRRKDWFDKGYILLNPLTGHKAFIYDWETLKQYQQDFKAEGFWDKYRELKQHSPKAEEVQKVKTFFKRKSDSEKQSINYPIQATGSMCLRYSMIAFWDYIVKNNLQNVVKICVAPYDEINCEAPEAIAEDVAKTLYNCMVDAGKIFCTRCKLDADISKNEDGSLPTYWIH